MFKSPIANICFLFFLLAIISACKKETSISGTVIDKSTNVPLEGVAVGLVAYNNAPPPDYTKVLDSDHVITDIDGRFFLEIESRNSNYLGYSALKEGYMRKIEELARGTKLDIDLQMYPIDSYLKVTAKNVPGDSDKVYYLISGEYFEHTVQYGYPWPHEFEIGDSISNIFKIPGGTNTLIYWGLTKNTSTWQYKGCLLYTSIL